MQFSATDNFGNLMVAESAARSDDELHADLAAMVQAVLAHHPGAVTFSVDVGYGEVAAPSGDQVSHIMSVPWFGEREAAGESRDAIYAAVAGQLAEIAAAHAEREIGIQGPWD